MDEKIKQEQELLDKWKKENPTIIPDGVVSWEDYLKSDLSNFLRPVFSKNYIDEYINVFESLYPSLNSTGFQERNLTVNFINGYRNKYKKHNIAYWYEFQFEGNNHLDAILIDKEAKYVFLIESKRFTNSTSKVDSSIKDILRINNLSKELKKDKRFDINEYSFFGIILADVWRDNNQKEKIYTDFKNQYQDNDSIINRMSEGMKPNYDSIYYDAFSFSDVEKKFFDEQNHHIKEEYALLIFSWAIHID